MNVYVESNFVLEQALEQERCESCERLIGMASAGLLQLVIPAFSLTEPHSTLLHRKGARLKLNSELVLQFREIARSKPYREVSASFLEVADILVGSAEREREALRRSIELMLRTAHVISLDADVLDQAGKVEAKLKMSAQDSIVLASIMSHLVKTKPAESCFLNRNTKDFDDSRILQALDEYGCKFFGRFDEGLHYIEARLANS
jgi:predicted nucleic acid-binding protein